MLAIAAVPFMPYTPTALTRFDPPIHVHSPLLIVYSHKSFRLFWVPALSDPNPQEPDLSGYKLDCGKTSRPRDVPRSCGTQGAVHATLIDEVRPALPGPLVHTDHEFP